MLADWLARNEIGKATKFEMKWLAGLGREDNTWLRSCKKNIMQGGGNIRLGYGYCKKNIVQGGGNIRLGYRSE